MAKAIEELLVRLLRRLFTALALFLAVVIPLRIYTELVTSGDYFSALSIGVERTFIAAGAFAVGQWLATRLERFLQTNEAVRSKQEICS